MDFQTALKCPSPITCRESSISQIEVLMPPVDCLATDRKQMLEIICQLLQ